jgi:ornithine decarboxylase
MMFEKSIAWQGHERTIEDLTTLRVPDEIERQFNVEFTQDEVLEKVIQQKMEYALEHEEAFYIVDLGRVIQKYVDWVRLLPRVHPFYAIKCNNDTAIVKTLGSLGVNFDCASKNEIQQVIDMGFDTSRIIYANPTKMKSHIAFARNAGVDLMTFDNKDELKKVAEVNPNARMVLRIITDDSNSVCKFSTKFGAPLHTTRGLLEEAKRLNVNVVGVSFHVGSGCMSVDSFLGAIRSAHRVFTQAAELGFNLELLDIGGGFPGTNDGAITFTEIANAIRPALDELFPAQVKIIAEPGRYFVSEAYVLATNLFAKRAIETPDSKEFLYYINEGVYQSFNCILFDHVTPAPLVFEPKGRTELYRCTLFGPTCDSMDCIAKGLMLPELEVGEWLYFKNMGAYTVAAASPFNGFKARPIIFYVQSNIH